MWRCTGNKQKMLWTRLWANASGGGEGPVTRWESHAEQNWSENRTLRHPIGARQLLGIGEGGPVHTAPRERLRAEAALREERARGRETDGVPTPIAGRKITPTRSARPLLDDLGHSCLEMEVR